MKVVTQSVCAAVFAGAAGHPAVAEVWDKVLPDDTLGRLEALCIKDRHALREKAGAVLPLKSSDGRSAFVYARALGRTSLGEIDDCIEIRGFCDPWVETASDLLQSGIYDERHVPAWWCWLKPLGGWKMVKWEGRQ